MATARGDPALAGLEMGGFEMRRLDVVWMVVTPNNDRRRRVGYH